MIIELQPHCSDLSSFTPADPEGASFVDYVQDAGYALNFPDTQILILPHTSPPLLNRGCCYDCANNEKYIYIFGSILILFYIALFIASIFLIIFLT